MAAVAEILVEAPAAFLATDEVASAIAASLAKAAPLPVIGLNREWRVTFWNRAAEREFGYPAPETLWKPLPLFSEADQKAFAELCHSASGGRIAHVPSLARRKNGALADVNISLAIERDRRGLDIGYCMVLADTETSLEAFKHLMGNALFVIMGHAELLRERTPVDAAGVEHILNILKTAHQALVKT